MVLLLTEEQQAHVYSCLLAGGKVWAQMKKGREKLELPTEQEDRELELNASLRMQLNPRAEELARARERKDPNQQDWTDPNVTGSSGETGGGHPAGEVVKLRLDGESTDPTDENLRDALLLRDDLVLLADIASWTSTERDRVVRYLNGEPEAPEMLDLVRLTAERVDALAAIGPYIVRRNLAAGDVFGSTPESYTVLIPEDESIERLEVVFGEYTDDVDAEVKAARLNRELIKHMDIADDVVERWVAAGPWSWEVVLAGSDTDAAWSVTHDKVSERALSKEDAERTAAKYNRTIAGKDKFGEWRTPPELPVDPAA